MMQTSKELFAERQRIADEQHRVANEGDKEQALVLEGQIKQLDMTLEHVLDEEAKLRNVPAKAKAKVTFAEAALGARDEFHGIDVGYKRVVDVDPTVVTVGVPVETEFELPGNSPSLLANFANTLPETPAIGSVQYKQRGTQYGNAGTWAGVDASTQVSATKEQVVFSFVDAVANAEVIAGYVPVSKPSLMDYDNLLDVIQNDLAIELADVTDAKYLTGDNSAGIVGITNTTGIQTYTAGEGGNYYDAIRKMRTLAMKNSRRIPTHVCVSPEIKEAIDLYKTTNGFYQTLGTDTLWGMQVVEDVNCPGILVYDAFAARRRAIRGGISIEVGYHSDQFIQNELTVLAEWTKALMVPYPSAFVYATKTDLDQTASVGA